MDDNLTIKTILEPIKALVNLNLANKSVTSEEVINNEPVETNNFFSNAKIYIYAGIVIVVVIIVSLLIRKRLNKPQLKKKKR